MNGDDLKAWRERRGLTSNALAVALGVRPSTVMRWERDQMRPNSMRLLTLALMGLDVEREAGRQQAGRKKASDGTG